MYHFITSIKIQKCSGNTNSDPSLFGKNNNTQPAGVKTATKNTTVVNSVDLAGYIVKQKSMLFSILVSF